LFSRADPELIREVGTKLFVSCFHDRALPTLALGSAADREFTARGMLFARKKYWKRLRAACEPMFHRGALASYMPLLHRAADALEATLAGAAASGASLNVADALAGTTMDVIGETAFGVEFHAQEAAAGGQPEILTASKRIFAPFGGVGRGLAVLFYAAPAFARAWAWLARALGSARVREVEASRGYLWGAAHALLHNSRAAGRAAAAGAPPPPAGPADAPEPLPQLHPAQAAAFQRALRDYAHVVPPSTSVIHRLRHAVNLDSGLPLSDADICAQSFTLMLAGYETTSLAISYALYELAKAPDLQARVAAEVAAVCANGGGEGGGGGTRRLAFADLGRLELTEAVFNEAMRMWPPVTPVLALAREAAAECAVGGWRVPRGARVQFDVHSMHHDPRHFPDPQEFRRVGGAPLLRRSRRRVLELAALFVV
jgi:cytochrome P450